MTRETMDLRLNITLKKNEKTESVQKLRNTKGYIDEYRE